MRFLCLVSIVSSLLVARIASGAEDRDPDARQPATYEPLVHPIIGGSTDIGFVGGLAGVLTKLSPGCEPFCWKLDATVSFSLKPEHDTVTSPVHFYDLRADIPGLAGGRVRLQPQVQIKRLVAAGYYGMGNASQVEGPSDAVSLYRYRYGMLQASAGLGSRLSLSGPLFASVAARFSYMIPEVYDESVLRQDLDNAAMPLRGEEASARPSVELGLGYDSRDNEHNPQRGMYHALVARLVPGPLTGGGRSYGELSLATRLYFPFIGEKLVGAVGLWGRALSGGAPFDEMDLNRVRGIPAGRYHGKAQAAGSLELRSMFARFALRRQAFGVGAVLFVDGGRVWADYRVDSELDGRGPGLHLGAGGGVRIQWGQTRVLRFDVAYSQEKQTLNPQQPFGMYLRVNQYF